MVNAQPDLSGGLAGLFAEHRDSLLRFLTARTGDAEKAQDLLQDMWIKTQTSRPGPVANGRAYLYRMAANLVLDDLRARNRAMRRERAWIGMDVADSALPEDRPDPAPLVDEEIAMQQEAAILERAIEALPEGARRALRLHRFEGMSHSQVAQTMGISRSGVEKHLSLAFRHLRNALADCGFFGPAESDNRSIIRGGEPRNGKRA